MTQSPRPFTQQPPPEAFISADYARLVRRSEATGMISEEQAETLILAPETTNLNRLIDQLNRHGIAQSHRWMLTEPNGASQVTAGSVQTSSLDQIDYVIFWKRLVDAVAESPVPEAEWKSVRELFEDDAQVAQLLGISVQSVGRYTRGDRPTPHPVGERLHALMMLASDLRGSYNRRGVRRWFFRPRVQLNEQTPQQVLGSDWSPESEGYRQIRTLADQELNFQAT